MEEDLLEVNVTFNEFDDEVDVDLENQLLEDVERTYAGLENIETCYASEYQKNSIENGKDQRKNETLIDLRQRLSSRIGDCTSVGASGACESKQRDEAVSQHGTAQTLDEATGEKRRKTGLESETVVKYKDEMCSNDEDEDEKMEVQTGAKRKRGGVKKRKKKQRDTHPVDTGIGMLLKPLDVRKCPTWKDLAREIIYRLNEPKKRLIYKVVEVIGVSDAWDLFKDTVKVQKSGGLWINNGRRRRSNGGVFLYLLKARGYATDEQCKEIFREENERANVLKKGEQNHMDTDQTAEDLRKLIDVKKSELLSMEVEKSSIS